MKFLSLALPFSLLAIVLAANNLVPLRLCTKSPCSGISLCNLSVLCVSVVWFYSEFINHRDTEDTEVAQRRERSRLFVQSLPLKDEVAFGANAFMQTSYELRCRGGALKFNSTPGSTSSSGEQMMNVTIDFAAGTQGAGARTPMLTPGQCSWVDRGFRPGEPTQIRLEIVSFGQQQQALHGSPVDRTPTAAERYPDAQNVPQYLSSSDHYWSFWVYNTSNGYLQSTAQRYFKPLKTLPGDKVRIPPPVRPGNVNESF